HPSWRSKGDRPNRELRLWHVAQPVPKAPHLRSRLGNLRPPLFARAASRISHDVWDPGAVASQAFYVMHRIEKVWPLRMDARRIRHEKHASGGTGSWA